MNVVRRSSAASIVEVGSEFDVGRLDAFLRDTYPDLRDELLIEKTQGGLSNPTYFLSCGEWSAVLRKQPRSMLSPRAHSIDREFRVMTALKNSPVPVPKPLLYHADPDVLGTPFYLMERIAGRVFSAYSLPGLSATARRASYDSMCRTMADIHSFDWRSAGLADFGREGNYFARQFKRWSEQWGQIRTDANPSIDRLIEWLADRIPASDVTTVCHGDLRIGNMIFHPIEPRVVGVLDWELSTLGHPLADVAFNVQAWRLKPEENGGILGLDHADLGVPSMNEYLESYHRYSGQTARLTVFHEVFAMFRAAVGCAGVAARGAGGTNADAAVIGGKLAKIYAKAGMDLAGA
jgi:aminoglycoside phosphotransferase (APT) family kinase protein